MGVILMEEKWKPLICQDIRVGWYEVSNFGEVRYKNTGRHLSPFDSKGYLRIGLMTNDRGQQKFPVHRLVATAFVDGMTDERRFVNHIDGNKHNNRSDNLEWVTASENTRHAIMTGLLKVVNGERNGQANVTEATVRDACELLVEFHGNVPMTYKVMLELGYDDITKGILYHLKTKSTWIHITDEYFKPEDFDPFHPNFNMTILIKNINTGHTLITWTLSKASTYIGKCLNISREVIYSQLQLRKCRIGCFRITYKSNHDYLVPDLRKWNNGKLAEEHDRVKHGTSDPNHIY
jgi:hypothetical protein